jgi:hypothetical protein
LGSENAATALSNFQAIRAAGRVKVAFARENQGYRHGVPSPGRGLECVKLGGGRTQMDVSELDRLNEGVGGRDEDEKLINIAITHSRAGS